MGHPSLRVLRETLGGGPHGDLGSSAMMLKDLQEKMMANRHSVTKRNRRQKSAKRVNHSEKTMAALRKRAEAEKEKAK